MPAGRLHPIELLARLLPGGPGPAQRVRRIAGAVLTAVLAITVTVVVTKPGPRHQFAAGAIAAGSADGPVPRALRAQAAALLRGDRAGWLASVDPAKPALRKRYQGCTRRCAGVLLLG
jgi:hypothetical protein